jgi:hypothetical protein
MDHLHAGSSPVFAASESLRPESGVVLVKLPL